MVREERRQRRSRRVAHFRPCPAQQRPNAKIPRLRWISEMLQTKRNLTQTWYVQPWQHDRSKNLSGSRVPPVHKQVKQSMGMGCLIRHKVLATSRKNPRAPKTDCKPCVSNKARDRVRHCNARLGSQPCMSMHRCSNCFGKYKLRPNLTTSLQGHRNATNKLFDNARNGCAQSICCNGAERCKTKFLARSAGHSHKA
jgi:hypothetical protein